MDADYKLPTCVMAEPIDDCDINFQSDVDVTANTTVGLELSFVIKTPLEAGDSIEIALPGFTADFENTT